MTAATLTSIVITPPDPSLARGISAQLSAIGNFSDGTAEDLTNQVSWTSESNSIAHVSNASGTQGLVTGLNVVFCPQSIPAASGWMRSSCETESRVGFSLRSPV